MEITLADYVELRRTANETEKARRVREREVFQEMVLRNAQEFLNRQFDELHRLYQSEKVVPQKPVWSGLSAVLESRGFPKVVANAVGRIGAVAGVTVEVSSDPVRTTNYDEIRSLERYTEKMARDISSFRGGYNARPEVVDLTRNFAPTNEILKEKTADLILDAHATGMRAQNARDVVIANLVEAGVPPKTAARTVAFADQVANVENDRSRAEAFLRTDFASEVFVGVPTGQTVKIGNEKFAVVVRPSDGRNLFVPEDQSTPSKLANEPLRFWPNSAGDFHVSLASEPIDEEAIAEDRSGPSDSVQARLEERRVALVMREARERQQESLGRGR